MKKKQKNKKQNISLILSSLLLFTLVCLVVYITSIVVIDYTTNISINKREKATIVYTDKSDEVITISNEVLLSDKLSMQSNNKYEFEISNSGNKNYVVNIVKVNSQIDDKYIKLYLTDRNDKKINSFSKPIKLSDLESINNNKVLYRGVLKNTKEKFILRIWVSDKYKSNSIDKFSFKINIEN